jgi:nucleotide-binding universal stress UspA family protein
MIKTILVAATGNDNDVATFAAALAIARPLGAHLEMLHVRLDPVAVAVAMTTDAGGGALAAGLIDRLEADAKERERRAHDLFSRFCADSGLAVIAAPRRGSAAAAPSAEWHVETGEEPLWMTTYGVAADLIVAPRTNDGDGVARTTLEAVLLESGRPILIPPAATMPAKIARIAIAWKPTPQAARAVTAAMPFLEQAAEILVATAEEDAEGRDEADRLARSLAWHGLKASTQLLTPGPEGAAATLLSAVGGRADLLVMGGYGHSRLREWVFGGFTEHLLASAPLAVLIAH